MTAGEESFENYQDNYNGLACMSFLPAVYVYFVLNRLFKSSSYTVKVIILSHTVFVSLSSPNSLLNPVIYCYRNKMFRSHARNFLE